MGLEIKINIDLSHEMYYICIMEKTTDIKFRKDEQGKFRAIIRGGRSTICFKSIKEYNRKESKKVNYED